ncbi:acyl-CoA synthetase family member 2, mitochondrial-like [Lingula anatina]|uniref:Acyl-CoA synthetase family member 2, mitochondrial-like n=1 Tax=Lingula anatina TaxID=7574 RepID=A0A1S3J122_LINAN|nr:acyl-CoA synthetase family member 2, mitochondrial-like [Lingula anatina]|eukprot:XP_013404142.1 acyl-CoA synthetase family member 2, mitochondrial-like [Lingula anatina]
MSTPNAYVTLPEIFDSTADRLPTKTAAVVYQSRQQRECLIFAELQKQSKTLAASLLQRGYTFGDRVAFFAPNCIEYFSVQLALCRIGCNAFLLSNLATLEDDVWQYRCRALIMYIRTGEEVDVCRKILTRKSRENVDRDVIIFGPKIDVISSGPKFDVTTEGTVTLSSVFAAGEGQNWEDIVVKKGWVAPNPEDPLWVLFTSGSTGKPKGVQYTHTKYLHQCPFLAMASIGDDSCFFNDRPFTGLGGSLTLLSMAAFGATGVTVNSALVIGGGDMDFVMEILKREECTHIVMMHYLMVDLVALFDPSVHSVPSLRYILTGGQRMKLDVIQNILDLLTNVEVVAECYGTTEVGLMAGTLCNQAYNSQDGEDIYEGTEVRIVDENHRDVPRGTSGEICVRSPTIYANCYVDNERASREAFDASGWFRTGDIGVMSLTGRITISGRKDDMIKRASDKLFPAEIEAILKQHHAVKDVVVIGAPDVRLGEEICACVILDEASSLAHVKEWCREKFPIGFDGLSLAPAYYVTFGEFPTTIYGKTNRRLIKQTAFEKLQL